MSTDCYKMNFGILLKTDVVNFQSREKGLSLKVKCHRESVVGDGGEGERSTSNSFEEQPEGKWHRWGFDQVRVVKERKVEERRLDEKRGVKEEGRVEEKRSVPANKS